MIYRSRTLHAPAQRSSQHASRWSWLPSCPKIILATIVPVRPLSLICRILHRDLGLLLTVSDLWVPKTI